MPGTNDAKRELRRTMRAVRAEGSIDRDRHRAIVARLAAMPEVVEAGTLMIYRSVPGEPDLGRLGDRVRRMGVDVVVPEADPGARFPVPPDAVDVVIVPGLAFTREGHRLGQGGGWYDRFLAAVRPDCVTIGVCFDEQVLRGLPVEPHDVALRWVVTPSECIDTAGTRDRDRYGTGSAGRGPDASNRQVSRGVYRVPRAT